MDHIDNWKCQSSKLIPMMLFMDNFVGLTTPLILNQKKFRLIMDYEPNGETTFSYEVADGQDHKNEGKQALQWRALADEGSEQFPHKL